MPVSRSRVDELSEAFAERIDMNDLKTRRPAALDEMAHAFARPLHRFVSRLVGQEAGGGGSATARRGLAAFLERLSQLVEGQRKSRSGATSQAVPLTNGEPTLLFQQTRQEAIQRLRRRVAGHAEVVVEFRMVRVLGAEGADRDF